VTHRNTAQNNRVTIMPGKTVMISIWVFCGSFLITILLTDWIGRLTRNNTCSAAFDNLNRWSARAIDLTCSRWVDEGVVTWQQIEDDIAQREWSLVWDWPGFDKINTCGNLMTCDAVFIRAMTLSSSDWIEMRVRDPDQVPTSILIDDITHEMSHFVLFAAGFPPEEHHPIMETRPWVPTK